MRTYFVRTRHVGQFSGHFIVPVAVEADSTLEAAQKRFDLLSSASRAGTLDLLVTEIVDSNERGMPYLFHVEHPKPIPARVVAA